MNNIEYGQGSSSRRAGCCSPAHIQYYSRSWSRLKPSEIANGAEFLVALLNQFVRGKVFEFGQIPQQGRFEVIRGLLIVMVRASQRLRDQLVDNAERQQFACADAHALKIGRATCRERV